MHREGGLDPWGLVKAGRYAEAADAYTTALRERESPPNYCNRGIAHLNQGMFDRAVADFEAAERCRPATIARGDAYGQWTGTAHWLAGDKGRAAQTWAGLVSGLDRKEIGYTDAAGGVGSGGLLWFAAVSLGDAGLLAASVRWLGKLCRRRPPTAWPGPIASFVLGRIDSDAMLAATSAVPMLHQRQTCQARFYMAIQARQAANPEVVQAELREAATLSEAKLEQEWYLARNELIAAPRSGGA